MKSDSKLSSLLHGLDTGLQSPSVPPSWLDKEACRSGRAFFMENITSIMISSGEALILGLCVPNFYRPLVMSGKSHRKEIAMSRYFTYTIVEVLPKPRVFIKELNIAIQ